MSALTSELLQHLGMGMSRPRLMVLHFDRFRLNVGNKGWKGGKVERIGAERLAEIEALRPLDITGDDFSVDAVLTQMAKPARADDKLHQVLLNQEVFAGCGNVIKVEAMFAVGLHPDTKVRHISEPKRRELVEWVRQSALAWLKMKRFYGYLKTLHGDQHKP